MSRKGGYKIIDFKGVELTEGTAIYGIMNDIINSKEKVLLISGAYLNGVKQEDEFATYTINGNIIYIKTSYGTIEIGDDIVDYIRPNRLKLVATGTYNSEHKRFNLDNLIEENKLYLIKYNNNEISELSTSISKLSGVNIVICSNQEGNSDIFLLYLHHDSVAISAINESEPILSSYDILEIYELPFTF